jgi:hypothetical protein
LIGNLLLLFGISFCFLIVFIVFLQLPSAYSRESCYFLMVVLDVFANVLSVRHGDNAVVYNLAFQEFEERLGLYRARCVDGVRDCRIFLGICLASNHDVIFQTWKLRVAEAGPNREF